MTTMTKRPRSTRKASSMATDASTSTQPSAPPTFEEVATKIAAMAQPFKVFRRHHREALHDALLGLTMPELAKMRVLAGMRDEFDSTKFADGVREVLAEKRTFRGDATILKAELVVELLRDRSLGSSLKTGMACATAAGASLDEVPPPDHALVEMA
jgi:hypothetical protein